MALRRRYDISSKQNDKFKYIKDLWTSRGIQEHKACLLFGTKLVREVLDTKAIEILYECALAGEPNLTDKTDVIQFSKDLFTELDEMGTGGPFLVARIPTLKTWDRKLPTTCQIVAPFSDPQNLGAAVRSAVGFGCEDIVLTRESAHPFLPRSIRASAGAVIRMNFHVAPSLGETAQILAGFPLGTAVALDLKGTNLAVYPWKKEVYILAGEEGLGIPEVKLPRLSIKTHQVESLNAAVSASIALYSYRCKYPLN